MSEVYDLLLDYKSKFPATVGWRLKKHADVLQNYLNPDEKVGYVFFGQLNNDWYRVTDTAVIAITNKRLLIGQKRLLWGSNYMQITPDLYNDMEVYSGMFYGKIIIDTIKETLVISNLSKASLDDIETHISEFMMNEKKKYHEA